MGRTIIGVVAGYLAMALFIYLTFSLAYNTLGANRAFEPGTYDVSALWITTSIVLGLIAALLGGYVCDLIAKRRAAVKALAVLVVVLGMVVALPPLLSDDAEKAVVRGEDVSNEEAMQNARPPGWLYILNPLIGAAGVLAGGCLRGKGSRKQG